MIKDVIMREGDAGGRGGHRGCYQKFGRTRDEVALHSNDRSAGACTFGSRGFERVADAAGLGQMRLEMGGERRVPAGACRFQCRLNLP